MDKEKPFVLQTIKETRGHVSVFEDIPFKVNRIFSIYDVPSGTIRGGHAHKKCHQLLIAMHGCVTVKVSGKKYTLDGPEVALYVPPKYQIDIEFFDEETILVVLASEKYDEGDYIYGTN